MSGEKINLCSLNNMYGEKINLCSLNNDLDKLENEI